MSFQKTVVTSTYVSISRCPAIFSLAFIFRPFVQRSSSNFHWKYICLPLQYYLDTCLGCKGFKNAYKTSEASWRVDERQFKRKEKKKRKKKDKEEGKEKKGPGESKVSGKRGRQKRQTFITLSTARRAVGNSNATTVVYLMLTLTIKHRRKGSAWTREV